MEFLKRCRSCPKTWESGIYCPDCGGMSDYVAIKKPADREAKRKKLEAYRKAATFEEVVLLTAVFGDKPGFAHWYWRARQFRRGKV